MSKLNTISRIVATLVECAEILAMSEQHAKQAETIYNVACELDTPKETAKPEQEAPKETAKPKQDIRIPGALKPISDMVPPTPVGQAKPKFSDSVNVPPTVANAATEAPKQEETPKVNAGLAAFHALKSEAKALGLSTLGKASDLDARIKAFKATQGKKQETPTVKTEDKPQTTTPQIIIPGNKQQTATAQPKVTETAKPKFISETDMKVLEALVNKYGKELIAKCL